MVTAAESVSLTLMVGFGLATAVVLAFMLRDVVARIGGDAFPGDTDGASEDATDDGPTAANERAVRPAVARGQRVAMAGPVVYLVGFVVVVASVVLDLDPVAGVNPVDVGIAVIVLAAAPMAAGLYVAWQGD